MREVLVGCPLHPPPPGRIKPATRYRLLTGNGTHCPWVCPLTLWPLSRNGQGQKRCFLGATSKDSPSRPSGADLCIFANSWAIWGGAAYPLKTTTQEAKLLSWNITWESGPGLAALSPAAHSRKPQLVGSICPADGGGHGYAQLCDNAGPVQSPSPSLPGVHLGGFLHCCHPSCSDCPADFPAHTAGRDQVGVAGARAANRRPVCCRLPGGARWLAVPRAGLASAADASGGVRSPAACAPGLPARLRYAPEHGGSLLLPRGGRTGAC